ncbi:MAG: collagen-like protein [Oscillospiraceae bacterium]|jgi:hypothetical protein|nr:collagen-like protein [Oscillospiraceae bacterium]
MINNSCGCAWPCQHPCPVFITGPAGATGARGAKGATGPTGATGAPPPLQLLTAYDNDPQEAVLYTHIQFPTVDISENAPVQPVNASDFEVLETGIYHIYYKVIAQGNPLTGLITYLRKNNEGANIIGSGAFYSQDHETFRWETLEADFYTQLQAGDVVYVVVHLLTEENRVQFLETYISFHKVD